MDVRIKAVIDADFFIKITEYEHGTRLFSQVMQDLDIYPVMHRFVADTELKSNIHLPLLIKNNLIQVIDYKDYLLTETDREDYDEYFRDAYEKLNRFPFSQNENIYEYAYPGENLGEIRSLYLAVKNQYPYFMSNDHGARFLAKTFFSQKHTINVKSLYEVLVQCQEQGTCLTWKDINPTVTNAIRSRQDQIDELRNRYRTV